jgi:3'-5' exoribonuclease
MTETGYFRCFYKVVLTTRRGDPMLAARLIDAHGPIGAVAFDQIDHLIEAFEPGDVVRVTGSRTTFRDAPRIRITAIQSVRRAPPEAIVPASLCNPEQLLDFAEHYAEQVADPHYSRVVAAAMAATEDLDRAPATTFSPHAYVGGLIEHTVAVARIAEELCELHPSLNRALLLTAALLHDLGRTRVFPRDDNWRRPGRDAVDATLRLVGEAAKQTGLPRRHWVALAACIAFAATRSAADEGPSVEATTLRCADMMDSTVGDAKRRRPPTTALRDARRRAA